MSVDGRIGVEQLLAQARAQIDRLTPREVPAEMEDGAALIDIRPFEQRQRDGDITAARLIDRNVVEWRLDPQSRYRQADVAQVGRRVIVICNEGYQSSLVAATLVGFGLDAADVIGGAQAWLAAGLPLERTSAGTTR